MNSDGKKISFGFSKSTKKPNILPAPSKENETVELIDCLEGTEIKVKNVVEKVVDAPLVIPIRGEANNIVSRIERESFKSKKSKTVTNDEDLRPDSELTIEELAARQLLKEARNKLAQERDTTKVHTVLLTENSTVQDGIEPSLNDYENVPIEDFGLALLRGMGWKEEISNQSKFVKPDIRPKGLGLGGQKIVDIKAEEVFDTNGKQLVIKEGAFAKIVAGPHKGKLCEIQFCDQWTGRVNVKTSKTNEILVLNELFVTPITKEDYIVGSKVINSEKYEQYKQLEQNESHKMRSSEASSEEPFKSRSDDSQKMNRGRISKNKELQQKLKLENDSSDEKVYLKEEQSSDDEYEKEKSRSIEGTSRYIEKKEEYRSSRSKHKYSKNHKKTPDKNKRDSSEEYVSEKSRAKYAKSRSRGSSEEYYNGKHEVQGKSKNMSNKYEKIILKSEYKRSRSRDSTINYNNQSSRSTSSEDCERNKSKARYKSRSRSSSTDYKKINTNKDKRHAKEKYRTTKYSSRYSDDDYERKKESKKHRQKNYTREESSYEVRRQIKKNKKSKERRPSSSESDNENKHSKYVEIRGKSGKHKSRRN